ncbi:hypothetical protein OSTOST_01576 [Ostertagia ostertagi]
MPKSKCSEIEHHENNHFKKRKSRKWMWTSPNMQTKNAIDFVLSSGESIFLDVDIIDGSNSLVIIDLLWLIFVQKANIIDFQENLKSEIKAVPDTARSKVPKRFHFSETTRELFEKLRLLLQQHPVRNTIEFSMVNKLLYYVAHWNLISCRNIFRLYSRLSRMDSAFVEYYKRGGFAKRQTPTAVAFFVQVFYNELLTSTMRAITTLTQMKNFEEVPQILPRGIEHAIETMKLGKKLGLST